jgi:hypothetical protein
MPSTFEERHESCDWSCRYIIDSDDEDDYQPSDGEADMGSRENPIDLTGDGSAS